MSTGALGPQALEISATAQWWVGATHLSAVGGKEGGANYMPLEPHIGSSRATNHNADFHTSGSKVENNDVGVGSRGETFPLDAFVAQGPWGSVGTHGL